MTNEATLVEVDLNMPEDEVMPFITSLTQEQCITLIEALNEMRHNGGILSALARIQLLKLKLEETPDLTNVEPVGGMQ